MSSPRNRPYPVRSQVVPVGGGQVRGHQVPGPPSGRIPHHDIVGVRHFTGHPFRRSRGRSAVLGDRPITRRNSRCGSTVSTSILNLRFRSGKYWLAMPPHLFVHQCGQSAESARSIRSTHEIARAVERSRQQPLQPHQALLERVPVSSGGLPGRTSGTTFSHGSVLRGRGAGLPPPEVPTQMIDNAMRRHRHASLLLVDTAALHRRPFVSKGHR